MRFGLDESQLVNAKYFFREFLKNANRRKIQTDLTFDQWLGVSIESCYLCGVKPPLKSRPERNNTPLTLHTLDRINSEIGYTITNVAPCCFQCNVSKNVLTLAEFREYIKRVYKFLGR